MGPRFTRAFTYTLCVDLFSHRKISSPSKRILRDCKLYDRGTHFEITHDQFLRWERVENGHVKITNEVPLATITRDNVLTMTYEAVVDMTVCARMASLIGCPVRLNKSEFRNYRQHVRVYCKKGTWSESEPYFAGMQWDVTNGNPRLLNPQQDMKYRIQPEVVQAAKKQYDSLRKLTQVMVRMGAFDALAQAYGHVPYKIPLTQYKPLADINPADPTEADVLSVLAHGGAHTSRAQSYRWVGSQYVQLNKQEEALDWLTRAAAKGLALMRQHFYEVNDGVFEQAA